MVPTTKAFYTIQELCARWNVSRTTIYREIERGRLHRIYIGGQVRFPSAAIDAYERKAGDLA